MNLDTSCLIEYLADVATIQDTTAFLEKTLSASLQITAAQSGLIALLDFEDGQEAGPEAHLLQRYLALQMAQTRAAYSTLELPLPTISPLGSWLPKTISLHELPAHLQKDRYVLTIPLRAYASPQPLGFLLLMLQKGKKAAPT